jgi:hypothetical protein
MTEVTEDRTQEQSEEGVTERDDLLAKLRGLHKEAKAEHHLDLPIPGYQNLVWARFRPYEVAKSESKIKEFQKIKNSPLLLKAACDTLIDGCEQIMLLPEKFGGDIGPDGENLIPIDAEAVPLIRFDSRLEELFNIENPSRNARGVVTGLFPTEQSVLAMHVRVSQWMEDVTIESDETLLGE